MRKQNSTFKTCFLSEAGSELANNDYFAYVELDKYACYVIADGLNEQPHGESAKLAIQTILLAFQEKPSIRKSAVLSYIRAGNQALLLADSKNRLKASVTVIITDYAAIRYAYVGNTRLRMYRDGLVKEQSKDMSLGNERVTEEKTTTDVLAKHEERNNLYTWLGQGKGFRPLVSSKIKLVNGDILTLYTRGIWENLDNGEIDDVFGEAKDEPQECMDNIEDLLLSRQPEKLENYTFATIFVDKVFLDPNQKRKRKKRITISIMVVVVLLLTVLILWIVNRYRIKKTEELEQKFTDTIEYIQDNNYVRAEEECKEALKAAEKLYDKKMTSEISDYLKLIEAVNKADESYSEQKYEEAQTDYVTAMERSRYADRVADMHIEKQLGRITDYLSVFDSIQLGDTLSSQGEYQRAEEKYQQAKRLATQSYFEEGRKEAMEALEKLYTDQGKAEEAVSQETKEKVAEETGAAELVIQGDKAFTQKDYEGSKVYYTMALEKYQELGDTAHAELTNTKMESLDTKIKAQEEQREKAAAYREEAQHQKEAGQYLQAKKQYLFAKNIYKELKDDDRVAEVDGEMELLEIDMESSAKVEETAAVEAVAVDGEIVAE